eukprot:GHVS01088667.1.p1 GENE.GHVS01088667.1~~GHVS01088667.1.p1  ORF type:complete len:184 (+),score=12.41 GHVS01088667.1:39-554(+)
MAARYGSLGKISLSPDKWTDMVAADSQKVGQLPLVSIQSMLSILESIKYSPARVASNDVLFFWKGEVQEPFKKFNVAVGFNVDLPSEKLDGVFQALTGTSWTEFKPDADMRLSPHNVHVFTIGHKGDSYRRFNRKTFVEAVLHNMPNGDIADPYIDWLLTWLDHDTTQTDP